MLELRPNCELCDKDLPPESIDACICSYECTFCADCVEGVLRNVCPNCGGGFTMRPFRPVNEHRPGVCRDHQPPSTTRVHSPFTPEEIGVMVKKLENIPPERR